MDDRLSAMHWRMIVYLTWFPCIIHMSGLTVLRRHLQKERWVRNARLALMLVLLLMLNVAMAPTAFFNWEEDIKHEQDSAATIGTPVICLFSIGCGNSLYQRQNTVIPFSHTPAFVEMLISQIVISAGFLARAFKLSTRLSERMQRNLVIPFGNLIRRGLERPENSLFRRDCAVGRTTAILNTKSLRYALIIRPVVAAAILFRTQADLFNSMLGEVSKSHTPHETRIATQSSLINRYFGFGSFYFGVPRSYLLLPLSNDGLQEYRRTTPKTPVGNLVRCFRCSSWLRPLLPCSAHSSRNQNAEIARYNMWRPRKVPRLAPI